MVCLGLKIELSCLTRWAASKVSSEMIAATGTRIQSSRGRSCWRPWLCPGRGGATVS